ncbi:MAG: SsrA-binding protein SmpB [Elusimicrobiota bacterium]|nr:SsrA-binding protein SmpB [Elusimicrobiota bacterium]
MPSKDKDKKDERKIVASHRKARHYYEILEVVEAGLELKGPEVKSLRKGQGSLDGCFARADGGELWLENFFIPPYSFATNAEPLDPRRRRKLLLKRQEIAKLTTKLTTKGLTAVPLEAYFKNGWCKIALALCRGKTGADIRDTLKKKAIRDDAEKSFKGVYRG